MKIIKYQLMNEIIHETVVPVERVDENGELVYEEVPVLDEYGQPVFDEDGNPIMESKVVIDYETKQEIEQIFSACEIQCSDETFEANYAIALKEAYNGEVTVEEVADPETEPTTDELLNAMLGVE
jgi:hypothetical protein